MLYCTLSFLAIMGHGIMGHGEMKKVSDKGSVSCYMKLAEQMNSKPVTVNNSDGCGVTHRWAARTAWIQ